MKCASFSPQRKRGGVGGRGTVFSYTFVNHPVHAATAAVVFERVDDEITIPRFTRREETARGTR